jgi:hypothetical protein
LNPSCAEKCGGQISCNADIKRASPAGQDVDPEFVIETIAHGSKGITAVWVELPDAAWLQNAFSGSFDCAPISDGKAGDWTRFAQDDKSPNANVEMS